MSDYTVRVNGLFPEVIKESKKVGIGLMKQVREGSHIPYEGLTQERLREVITEVFAERPLPTIIGGARAQEILDQAFRDQLITGESSFTVALNEEEEPTVSRYVVGIDPYDSDGTVTLGYINNPEATDSQEERRRLVIQTLQRQLQTGQISTMDYLDLISQQE